MPYAIDSSTLSQLQEGRIIAHYLILAEPDEGSFGFWGGEGPLDYDNGAGVVTYVGAGRLIEVDDIVQVSDGSAIPLTLKISSIPNSDLTPDVLATVQGYTWHQRPITIMTGYFDPDTLALLSVETELAGYMDLIEYEEIVGGEATLRLHIESKARDHLKIGYRMRSSEDQKQIDANDGGLRHTHHAATVDINWGRTDPGAATEVLSRREQRRKRRQERRDNR